ncbi:MAG: diaminopimelate decarboxylase [Actinobacteria bacterium]|nr:diaminopimelate decarboxylase [Actinomycetota bacterium]
MPISADLNPAIWPRSAARSANGELSIAGNLVSQLLNKFESPIYVYDADEIFSRAKEIKEAFDQQKIVCDVHYASKAFLSKSVAKIINQAGLHLDVASGGELTIALVAGFPAARIAFHGNNKSIAELELAVRSGVGHIIVDSIEEINRLNEIATKAQANQAIMIRASLGINAETHEYISTAHEDQKFGLSASDGSLENAVTQVLGAPALQLIGLHCHIGSQVLVLDSFIAAASKLVAEVARINDKFGLTLNTLGLGGGFGIAYIESDKPVAINDIAKVLNETVLAACAEHKVSINKITVEPGRFIVGPAGITLYTVGTVKPVTLADKSKRIYVSVDGGMSDNIRTALYEAQYTAVTANRVSTSQMLLSRIVGKHCESGDILVRDCYLPADIQSGDIIAVAATGAYCRSMSSQYNGTPRPAVIGITKGSPEIWLRRESYEDLLALDLG